MDLLSIFTVGFVLFLIICLSSSFAMLYLPALYLENTLLFYVTSLITLITTIIGGYCYLKSVYTSPGYPEPNLKHHYALTINEMKRRAEEEKEFKKLRKNKKIDSQNQSRQIKMLLEHSYCEKCDNVKLSRVHHCKFCKNCIQRMDHHCPWIGNCVGKYNHKYFLLFLFYITIDLFTVSASILIDYVSPQKSVLSQISKIDEFYYILTLITGGMCLLLLCSIGFLLINQVILLCQNLTTLQSFYNGIMINNPFQKQRVKDHLVQIFGNSNWLLPTKPFPEYVDYVNVALSR